MNTNSPAKSGLELDRRKLIIVAAALLIVAAGWGLWHYLTHPPRPWMVRRQVTRFLEKNTANANFRVDFPFPSKAEMAKPPAPRGKEDPNPKGQRTGKDFDTLAKEYIELKTALLAMGTDIPESEAELKVLKPRLETYSKRLTDERAAGTTNNSVLELQVTNLQKRIASLEKTAAGRASFQAKEEAIVPILSDLWDFQRLWAAELAAVEVSGTNPLAKARADLTADIRSRLAEAKSYELIYRAVGQELWVAEHLLESGNPAHQRMGIELALEASRLALRNAENGWLASRICEGYIWPHLDAATDSNRRSTFNLENLLDQCAAIFGSNDETETVVRNYKILLAKAKTPQVADAARAQIGMTYMRGDNPKEALVYLRQIKLTNDYRWALNWIPRLQQQLKTAR
jgi:hypothetical protein